MPERRASGSSPLDKAHEEAAHWEEQQQKHQENEAYGNARQ